ncbi:unnamed protein product [Leptidea sinapis]|uniref:PX domain-containing protein n=1 Tax=Leptidea sinapis TaxID=189913 RepID=A0A5E4QLQ6_9NEOP|nr:unnamed protein product [Leptidea sinapis]
MNFALCRLPPKRVVVGGGSPLFLQRRRAALQRWLTLVARHPVLAHDADLRTFLCESSPKLEKPKHDEFVLAGTQDDSRQEQLRLVRLGLERLTDIFEKAEARCESEFGDIRELGAGLNALSTAAVSDEESWERVLIALDALTALKDLCSRLTRGLHAERAAAAASAPHSAAARGLRERHRYAKAA